MNTTNIPQEPTLRQLDKEARSLGIKRATGSYNNGPYWTRDDDNAIITRDRLLEILGYGA